MTFGRFYGYFAAAYGTIWLVLMLAALLTQSSIDAGAFGLFGFPIIALVYAFIRASGERTERDDVARLRERLSRLEGEFEERERY